MTHLDEQFASNAALVEQRVNMGDLADYPRRLDHMADLPRKGVDGAVAALRTAGFRVDSVKKGFRRVRVEFSREDAATLVQANAVTQQIVEIVDEHSGIYDGWAAFLLTEPPPE